MVKSLLIAPASLVLKNALRCQAKLKVLSASFQAILLVLSLSYLPATNTKQTQPLYLGIYNLILFTRILTKLHSLTCCNRLSCLLEDKAGIIVYLSCHMCHRIQTYGLGFYRKQEGNIGSRGSELTWILK